MKNTHLLVKLPSNPHVFFGFQQWNFNIQTECGREFLDNVIWVIYIQISRMRTSYVFRLSRLFVCLCDQENLNYATHSEKKRAPAARDKIRQTHTVSIGVENMER